jgi:LmbE family N-acetylglucosaminyl deacetylase
MTSGESASEQISKRELGRTREREARRAAQVIGFNDLTFLRNPDGYLEYSRSNLITLVGLIRKKRPNIVYVPHRLDGHRDHAVTSELVSEALGRAAMGMFQEYSGKPWRVDVVLAYEVWTPLSRFEYVEDVSDYIDKKCAALKKHESQMRIVQYDEASRSLARFRGAMTRKGEYCEVFNVQNLSML